MRRVAFDFPNTCPRIDKEIGAAKDVIQNFLESLLEEACPLLGVLRIKEIAALNTDNLYRDLEDCFEAVRSTNEEMRREADRQIFRLIDELNDMEAELKDARAREAA